MCILFHFSAENNSFNIFVETRRHAIDWRMLHCKAYKQWYEVPLRTNHSNGPQLVNCLSGHWDCAIFSARPRSYSTNQITSTDFVSQYKKIHADYRTQPYGALSLKKHLFLIIIILKKKLKKTPSLYSIHDFLSK